MSSRTRALGIAAVVALHALSCGGKHEAKSAAEGAATGGDDPAPKWESTGEAAPRAGPATASSSAGAPAKDPNDLDLDKPVNAGPSELRATIGGKALVFRASTIHGNPREGFRLQSSDSATHAEMNAQLAGNLARGRAIAVTLTFLQIPDDGPNSLRGVRAVECSGKGKLVLGDAPNLPKTTSRDELEIGVANGTLTMQVKCAGDAKELGTFAIEGPVRAKVILTPAES